MSDTLQTFCVSKPILLISISILWRTWSPAHTHTEHQGNYFRKISYLIKEIPEAWSLCVRTWATEMNVLVFIISAASQTPGMIGQGEQVLQPRRVSYGPVQTLDPLLALLERCKVASVEKQMWRLDRLARSNNKISRYNVTLRGLGEKQEQLISSDVQWFSSP